MPVQGSDGGGVGQGLTCLLPAPARASGPHVHTIRTGAGLTAMLVRPRPPGSSMILVVLAEARPVSLSVDAEVAERFRCIAAFAHPALVLVQAGFDLT